MVRLERHTEPTILIHLTTDDRIESIMKNGIKMSEYGDLEVDGNDGMGVYAVKTLKGHADLVDSINALSHGSVSAVTFSTGTAEWYECVAEMPDTEDDDDFTPFHVGYIVIPHEIPTENIIGIEKV